MTEWPTDIVVVVYNDELLNAFSNQPQAENWARKYLDMSLVTFSKIRLIPHK